MDKLTYFHHYLERIDGSLSNSFARLLAPRGASETHPEPTKHTAPDCASSGGPFFIGSLFVIMMYLRGYLVISEAT